MPANDNREPMLLDIIRHLNQAVYYLSEALLALGKDDVDKDDVDSANNYIALAATETGQADALKRKAGVK